MNSEDLRSGTQVTGGARFVGQRVARSEDARFLTGRGRYVDDVFLPGTLHVAFARSDLPHGTIASIDVAAAAAMPGVVAVLLASDVNTLVRDWLVDGEGPELGWTRPFRVLADGDVRLVGEPIAIVVADSRYRAEDAVEAIEIDIEPRPAVVDVERALDDAPLVHPGSDSNLLFALPAPEASDSTGTQPSHSKRGERWRAGTRSARS